MHDVQLHPDTVTDTEMFGPQIRTARAKASNCEMMTRFGFKTIRALYKNMMNCGIRSKAGVITIAPTHHERLCGWSREKGDGIEDVLIPATSAPVEVGAALRLAFSRCAG